MRCFVFLLLTCAVQGAVSQKNSSFVQVRYGEGILLAHRPSMYHLVQKNNRSVELSWLTQLNNDSPMTALYRKPLFGVNICYRSFGNPDVLGSGFGISYVMRFPLVQTKRNLCVELQTQSGFGIVTKHYDKLNNPKNIAIGSYLNAKPDLEIFVTKFTKRFHFGGGIGFSHFSNGAMKNPNLGLNTLSVFLSGGYNFGERQIAEKVKFPERKKMGNPYTNHNLNTDLIFSVKEANPVFYTPRIYPVVGVRVSYVYRPRIKWGADVSLDFIYNAANPHIWPEDGHTASEAFQIGLYTGAVMYMYKTAIYFGGGVYLFDPVAAAERIYDRIGIQQYFNDKFYALFAIKANYAKADYFEFGLGYKVKAWGKN